MSRTKEYRRVESAEGRAKCASHAVSELLAWEHPGTDGWVPTEAQIMAKTNALYGWVRIDETEARTALEDVLGRQAAA